LLGGLFENVFAEFVAALAGYLVGLFWQQMRVRITYRKYWNFWGPVFAQKFHVVVSSFHPDNFNDPLGVVGGGDAYAMREISKHLSLAGIKENDAVYSAASLDRDSNLVLIGGIDTNSVTREALRLIRPCVRVFDPGMNIPMEVHDLAPYGVPGVGVQEYAAKLPEGDKDGLGVDYGIIVRARNPFFNGKSITIIAGAYGSGSWAGAKLAVSPEFLGRCRKLEAETDSNQGRRAGRFAQLLNWQGKIKDFAEIECIFKVVVSGKSGSPFEPEIVFIRRLKRAPGEVWNLYVLHPALIQNH
jgi:hypothetical protein